jgi:hypothetical protein
VVRNKKKHQMSPHIDKFRQSYGNYSRSSVQNLFILLGCIIQGKTVNLYNLKDEVGKITEKYNLCSDGYYRRLTRFFVNHSHDNLWLSVLNYSLDLLNKKPSLCYLDATEWKIGKFKLHCLVLAIDYQAVAIPIYFKLYCHKGVLSELERISFIKSATDFSNLINLTIIADREFIGNDWFVNFYDLSLNFIIRLRKGQYKANLIGNRTYENLQKRAIKKGKASSIILIEGIKFRLWVVKNASKTDNEPLIYILTSIIEKRNIPDLYRLRWKIECLFKHLKTNGYNLEDLRMTNLDKIRLLIAILVLAYVMAILTAIQERKKKPVRQILYQDGRTFDAISAFKQGQQILKQSFISLRRFLEIIQYLNVLIITPLPQFRLNVQ